MLNITDGLGLGQILDMWGLLTLFESVFVFNRVKEAEIECVGRRRRK